MAGRIAQAGVRRADPRRQFREPRLSDRDHAARALRRRSSRCSTATAEIEERMMLRARTLRAGAVVRRSRRALNDVVITKGALSRIIDLSVSVGDELVMQRPRRRPDRREPDRFDRLQPRRGRPDRAPGGRRDAAHADRAAHADESSRGSTRRRRRLCVSPDMNGKEEVFVTFDGQSGHALQAGDTIEISALRAQPAARPRIAAHLLRRAQAEVEVGRSADRRISVFAGPKHQTTTGSTNRTRVN